jgi:hypothetical protein
VLQPLKKVFRQAAASAVPQQARINKASATEGFARPFSLSVFHSFTSTLFHSSTFSFKRRLSVLSPHIVKEKYRQTVDRCRLVSH